MLWDNSKTEIEYRIDQILQSLAKQLDMIVGMKTKMRRFCEKDKENDERLKKIEIKMKEFADRLEKSGIT